MFKHAIAVIKANKTTIVRRTLVLAGAAAGLALAYVLASEPEEETLVVFETEPAKNEGE